MGKPRLKYEKYKELLFDELNKGSSVSTKKTNFYELLRTKYSISKQNALSYYDKAYLEWIGLIDIDKEYKSNLEKETNAKIKTGLKTKIDRLLNYQKMVDDCLDLLTNGTTRDITFVNGKPKEYSRKMTVHEINQTRRTLKELQSEISKIEGDYMANKIEVAIEQPLFPDVKIKE